MTTVLLIDDNGDDLTIISRAFAQVGVDDVVAMQSATAAIDWIANADTADVLVVTDLNMPGIDGIAMIKRLREACSTPPIMLVMSTSDRTVDVDRAYAAGANGFHTKPMGFHDTATLCRQIAEYWLSAVARPTVA